MRFHTQVGWVQVRVQGAGTSEGSSAKGESACRVAFKASAGGETNWTAPKNEGGGGMEAKVPVSSTVGT